jgi:hypothetical protein
MHDSIWALIVGGDDVGVDIDLYLTEWRIRFAHPDVAGHIRQAAVYNKETSNVGRCSEDSAKGALGYPLWPHLYYNRPRCKPHRPT